MNLKEFATERKWKLKFLMLLIGLVVCTGSDLLVKGIVEKKLRNVPENVSGYAFEKQFLNFDTEDKIIENAYEKLEDGSYQLKEKDAKKKQKTVEIKEVRLSPNIETNDLNTKVNNAKKFITKGNKVKVTLRFRGREMAHMQQSKHILDDFAEMLADVATVEKAPKLEGRAMSMVLTEKR
jgi:hypothetical protein